MQQRSAPPFARSFSPVEVAAEQAAFMRKVYAIMAAGLGVTALTALVVAHSESARSIIYGSPLVFFGLLIAEVLMVVAFSAWARRMSAVGAAALFYVYAITNGLTLSVVFLVYNVASVTTTFLVTAVTFGGMSLYGFVTKRSLDGIGHFCVMGLWGLIVASMVNLFLRAPMLYWLTTYAGVLIFVGLIAYDTQKIRQLNVLGNAGTEEDHKEAIHGALVLYLDFVNLFLLLLRLFGRRR